MKAEAALGALVMCLLSEACSKRANPTDILLFDGTGTSRGDVAALRALLKQNNLNFTTATSTQLNRSNPTNLQRYRLLVIPGGNFIEIGNSLTPTATANIRSAVSNGLNYLGICAGAFFGGNSPFNGLNLTSGVRFGFYGLESHGIRKAAVSVTPFGSNTLDAYWEDGPQLSGWGDVVAKYPDGTPAVTEAHYGNGWVILSGIHPEADARWRSGMTFHTSIADDQNYALTLIRAALNRTSLPHY